MSLEERGVSFELTVRPISEGGEKSFPARQLRQEEVVSLGGLTGEEGGEDEYSIAQRGDAASEEEI